MSHKKSFHRWWVADTRLDLIQVQNDQVSVPFDHEEKIIQLSQRRLEHIYCILAPDAPLNQAVAMRLVRFRKPNAVKVS